MAAAIAVLLAMVGLAAMASPASATGVTLDQGSEADLLARHNQARRDQGLVALNEDGGLREVARAWANELARSQSLRHNPDVVAQVDARVTPEWSRLGENVGRGPTIADLQTAFMNSPGHRANILGDYNRVGVGAVRDAGGQLWVVIVFMKGNSPVPAQPVAPPPAPAISWRPFETPEDLASQQYGDFLGRTPDGAGVAYWADQLRAGRVSGAGAVESFLRSPEFAGVIAPVVRLFLADQAGAPNQAALQSAIDRVRDGASLRDIAAGLAGSAGADALVARSQSPEFQWISANQVLVAMAYVGMLHRTPEAGGFGYWVNTLNQGHSPAALLGGILASPEYAARF